MIIGMMVARNEASRYLQASLLWNVKLFDKFIFIDDRSTDSTAKVAASCGVDKIVVLGDSAPKFDDHEGEFRAECYRAMEEAFDPTENDWVFSLDADEFFVGSNGFFGRDSIDSMIDSALEASADAMRIRIPEVWDMDGPRIRMDGFWHSNYNPRIWRYRKEWEFKDKKLASGSGPGYVWAGIYPNVPVGFILHYGYADPVDRELRYERYKNDRNHSPQHIKSIMSGTPDLDIWRGETPEVWRGVR